MNQEQQTECRYFVSYSGIKLPLKLVNEITEDSLNNRNTYYRGYFDAQDRMLLCQKVVFMAKLNRSISINITSVAF